MTRETTYCMALPTPAPVALTTVAPRARDSTNQTEIYADVQLPNYESRPKLARQAISTRTIFCSESSPLPEHAAISSTCFFSEKPPNTVVTPCRDKLKRMAASVRLCSCRALESRLPERKLNALARRNAISPVSGDRGPRARCRVRVQGQACRSDLFYALTFSQTVAVLQVGSAKWNFTIHLPAGPIKLFSRAKPALSKIERDAKRTCGYSFPIRIYSRKACTERRRRSAKSKKQKLSGRGVPSTRFILSVIKGLRTGLPGDSPQPSEIANRASTVGRVSEA